MRGERRFSVPSWLAIGLKELNNRQRRRRWFIFARRAASARILVASSLPSVRVALRFSVRPGCE